MESNLGQAPRLFFTVLEWIAEHFGRHPAATNRKCTDTFAARLWPSFKIPCVLLAEIGTHAWTLCQGCVSLALVNAQHFE